jgi:quinol monooxygenase YgiN
VITVLVRCRLQDDAAKQAEAESIVADVIASTLRDEPEALSYNFYRGANDPRELILVETYVSNEAFLKHNTSPCMLRFRERFAELFDVTTNRVEMLEPIGGFSRTSLTKVEETHGSGG